MKTLIAPTEEFIKSERTTLKADIQPGSSVVLTVANTQGLIVGDNIAIGHEGSDTAELQRISVIGGNTSLTVATIKFAHTADEPIVKYKYNQRKFYGSETKAGTFTHLVSDGSPKEIEVDDPQGTLLEYTGGVYSYFKATYFNSFNSDETPLDESEAVLADESKRYASIQAIKSQAGLSRNKYVSDGDIEVYRKRAENEVNSIIGTQYILPLSEVPAIIENATVLLAAGYIDYKYFGRDGEGVKWLGEARGLLKSISDGRQKLLAEDGTELALSNTGAGEDMLGGYPSSEDEPNQMFSLRDKF